MPPVSVPQIHLPKKSSKESKEKSPEQAHDGVKMTLRGVDGTLRELGERDLYLEVGGNRVLKFRLLAKTQFKNKQGEPVRDSLLKPGDQLAVQVNSDDPETALRVILSRAATPAERSSASKPFDHASAKVPVEDDTKPAGTIEVASEGSSSSSNSNSSAPIDMASADEPSAGGSSTSAGVPPESDPNRPRIQRRPKGGQSDTTAHDDAPPVTAKPAASGKPDYGDPTEATFGKTDEAIEGARTAAESFTADMPNFVVQQLTTRYYSYSRPAQWRAQDVVSAEVVSVNGSEEYRNVSINGKPTKEPIEKTGSWSTGEFVSTLQDILSPMTAAAFTKRGSDTIAGRSAVVYDYSVKKERSHWRIIAPDGRAEAPPYTGAIWVDKDTHRVLRIEQRTGPLPNDFPYDKAESTLDYDFVRIESKNFLLPVRSENLACQRGSYNCSRNEISFRNYRKFTSDTNIKFEKAGN